MKNLRRFELDNGMTGFLLPLPGLSSVIVQVYVKIGSKYEKRKVWGISHFLEHLAFKGTKKRKTAVEISREFDRVGAVRNASTGNERTDYYVRTSPKHLEWGIEILSDMLLNPIFDEKAIEKERGVIIEEINMYEDNPIQGLSSDFIEVMYKEKEVGCLNIIGSKESVLGLTREDIVGYRKEYLNSEEMVLVVAGNLEGRLSRAEKWVRKYFGPFERGRKDLPETGLELGEKLRVDKKKGLDQGHFVLGLPALARMDERRYVQKLLTIMLFGNSSSRMYRKIREEMGAAYYVFSAGLTMKEGGYMAMQTGVPKNRLEEVIKVSRQEWLKMAETAKEEELEMAKDYLFGRLSLAMDGPGFWTDWVGERYLLEGRVPIPEKEMEKYRRVDIKDIKKLARELFLEDAFRLLVAR